ncbi:MAG: Trk system potassium transporter TrkA [Clostridia bacterium]|nr:Trk system potassium transporter TrkA [Clostridia bacterium]MBO4884342.1 Trk system potassium transporter TrkA [Clostridia bacterium]
MNIIVVGDGKVGYTLAEYLSKDGHDITIVDKNRRALQKASETLDVLCVMGSGANLRTLIEAGAETADVVIAATTNDEMNMVCCLAAKQLGARYTIARIRDPEYTESLTLLQDKLDIDQVINPERATALEISRLMRFPFAINVESFAHGRVEMVEFRVEESDRIDGIPLAQLHTRYPHVQFTAVLRGDDALIPDGSFEIQVGDRLYVTGDRISVTAFFKQLGKDTQKVKNAILIGGGHVSYYLAKTVAGMGIHLKIVEMQEEKCRSLSESLDNAVIINGDGTDRELLESEHVRDHDALICLTDRDEENLVTGLYGVRLGMRKVIVKINRLETMDIIGDMGIDSVVSPKLATANVILRAVRARSHSQNSVIEKVYPLLADKAEAYEFVALPGANYLNIPLNRLNNKKGVLVSMIVRGRQIIIPFGSDHIEAGDTVILTARAGTITELKDAFNVTEK